MRTLIKRLIPLMALAFVLIACESTDHQREDRRTQDDVQTRLQQVSPVPDITGAAARDAVGAHIERWQSSDVVSYVNIFSEAGAPIGFFTAQGKVASTCQMMTAPDRTFGSSGGVRSAPALDGTYYGDNVDCGHFFFTADSDSYVEIHGGIQIITDQPLPIDVQPLEVSSSDDD